MLTDSDYKSINCGWYDRLIAACEKKESLDAEISTASGSVNRINMLPVDIFSKNHAEWLKTSDGKVIRLDHILSINGDPLNGTCRI